MPYTLTKGLLWFLLALLIGIVIGWLLRSIRATSQLRSVRAARHESAELERLRGRVANLEPAVAERDRLQAELARGTRATTPAASVGDPVPRPSGPPAEPDAAAPSTEAAPTRATQPEPGDDVATHVTDVVEVADAVERAPGTDAAVGEAREPAARPETDARTQVDTATEASTGRATATAATVPGGAPPMTRAVTDTPTPDVSVAAAVLGRPIRRDDLTVIAGINPAIAGLCHGIGITTWAELADTEVSLLRTMLADAGPRFAERQPDTWPQQARLLATGRWDEFQSLASSLDSDKLGE